MNRILAALVTVLGLASYAVPMNVLVFSRTTGFRHDSIPAGITCLKAMAERNGWGVTCTEDPAVFSDATLAGFDVTVWLMTTGDVLDAARQEAFARFTRSGKGFVGVHSATITETDWPWFVDLVGAKFVGHPPTQKGRLIVEDRDNPSIPAAMPNPWTREDEWYSFDRNPRGKVRVLASIDESSYDVDDNQWFPGVKQRMGDHPLVWCHEYDGGRAFQTALGHTVESYVDPIFVAHLKGAIRWAAAGSAQEKTR
jgi:type 1 glutamine amidotransferase